MHSTEFPPTSRRPNTPIQQSPRSVSLWSSVPWKSAVAVVTINVGFAVVVHHVLHTPGYAVTGRLPALLPWTLAINTSFFALILIFAWRANWQQRLDQVLYSSVVVSALPFFLPRALRLPKTEERLHALGLIYAVFLLSLAFVAFFYAWANAHVAGRRSLRVWILTASMLVYAGTTGWMRLSSEVAGDEPHYLLMSHSLVYDHDFDLSNNYTHQDYRAYFPHPMAPQTVPGLNGMAMSWHDIGQPLLMAPGYWWIGWTGAMLTVNLITSLLALGIFEAAVEMGATSVAGVLAWGLFAFSAPLMVYNSQLYPETAGAAGALWAVILFSRFVQEGQRIFLWAAGILLALLPWLCIRYWMLVGPLLVVIALYIFMHNRTRKGENLVALTLPLGLSLTLFAWFDAGHFGTLLPNAGFLRVIALHPQYTHIIHPLRGLLGMLFDRLQGVIPFAPIYLWSLAGLLCGLKKARWPVAALTVASWSYLVSVAFSQNWPGGYCPPARIALSAVLLWAPTAAFVLRPSQQRWLFGAAFFWSAFAAFAYTGLSQVRYPHRSDVAMATSQLDRFVRTDFRFDFDVVFPCLTRNTRADQILAAIWVFLSIACVWFLNRGLKRKSADPVLPDAPA
jgi:hypothetical protein